jgi:pyruvate formate lyase activating enzyme
MKEAMFYKKLKGKKVQCVLCPRNCIIGEGQTGFCKVRKNIGGVLYSLVYGKPVSIAVDPIEKKPLFHFAPGTQCLSLATVGCNLACRFCQNWEISQEFGEVHGRETSPEEIVRMAKDYNVEGISYTYTEPTIFFEYAFDIMKLAKKEGFYNMWVSNGYTEPEVIKKMSKYLDGINVDLKGNDEFYRKLSLAPKGVNPVFESLKTYKKFGVWVEVTNLIIPRHNDSKEEISKLVKWVKANLGVDTPLHFSAFYPQYNLTDVEPTPVETLERAFEIAKSEGLRWVYVGNIYGHKLESTWCWKCGELLIKRMGFSVESFASECPKCGEKVPIRGKRWMK